MKALRQIVTLLLVVMMSAGAGAAGMVTSPVIYTLPSIHMIATQTDQRTGTYARQGFVLNLRPNAVANVRLQGLSTMTVQVSGKMANNGTVELTYSVLGGGHTYGPSRMRIDTESEEPVNNTFYLGDVALALQFSPMDSASVSRLAPHRAAQATMRPAERTAPLTVNAYELTRGNRDIPITTIDIQEVGNLVNHTGQTYSTSYPSQSMTLYTATAGKEYYVTVRWANGEAYRGVVTNNGSHTVEVDETN